jgi:nucleotide-binding universal stress UspA family protein
MSETTEKYGILVCVDGSAASDNAVAWATRETIMRQLPLTLMHCVPPIVVDWSDCQLDIPGWQRENAQHVIDQARKTISANLRESERPEIHTEVLYSSVVPTLIDASRGARMIVTVADVPDTGHCSPTHQPHLGQKVT